SKGGGVLIGDADEREHQGGHVVLGGGDHRIGLVELGVPGGLDGGLVGLGILLRSLGSGAGGVFVSPTAHQGSEEQKGGQGKRQHTFHGDNSPFALFCLQSPWTQ